MIQLSKQAMMQRFKDLSINDGSSQKHYEEDKTKKKKLNLKKKKPNFHPKLFSKVDVKYVVNIGNICFLTEDALRNPETSQENVLKSAYHHNMVSKITFNDAYVCMDFKKHNQNFLPPEYFIERFRSFGDKQMAGMADHIEKIHQQFSIIKEEVPTNDTSFCRQNEEMMLQKFIESRRNKKFFLYFSQITPQKITLKNVIFSIPLLQAIGCDAENIKIDFLKYNNVFFDVYTAKNYGNVIEKCFQKFGKIQASLMANLNLSMEERINLTEFTYYDDVVCRKSTKEGEYEQILPAKCLWFSPHPSICYFEVVDILESQTPLISKRKKASQEQIFEKEEGKDLQKKLKNNKEVVSQGQLDSYTDNIQKVVPLVNQSSLED